MPIGQIYYYAQEKRREVMDKNDTIASYPDLLWGRVWKSYKVGLLGVGVSEL